MRSDSFTLSVTGEQRPKTVLLAEEDPALRDVLASVLREDGYQVIALEDGLALCDYLERAQFSNGVLPLPDLILSDAKLSGYDGLSICRMVTREKDATPFILIAPTDDAASWEGAEEAGACHVLEKPVKPSELHDAIACYLEET